jgi:hypothetical protein
MKTRFSRIVLAAMIATGISTAPVKAFDPFFGFYFGPLEYLLVVYFLGGGSEVVKETADNAQAKVTQTGTPYDAKIEVTGKDGADKMAIEIQLNADGTGTCVVNGSVVAGSKPKARGLKPGGKLKFKSKAAGSWSLNGIKTTMVFNGKTNGVPTIITATMDLSPQGALLLDVKFKYQRNKLLKKTSMKLVAPRK